MPEHRLQNCKQRMPWRLCVGFKRRSPAEKLEEEKATRLHYKAGRKTPRYRKTKWLKIVIRIKTMFFLLNLDLSYRRYQNVYFHIICAQVVYPPGEKLSQFTHLVSIKDFLDVYNVEHPSQT